LYGWAVVVVAVVVVVVVVVVEVVVTVYLMNFRESDMKKKKEKKRNAMRRGKDTDLKHKHNRHGRYIVQEMNNDLTGQNVTRESLDVAGTGDDVRSRKSGVRGGDIRETKETQRVVYYVELVCGSDAVAKEIGQRSMSNC
jgi:hypothetical protein